MSFAAGIAAALILILCSAAVLVVISRPANRMRRKWRDRNPIIKDWNS